MDEYTDLDATALGELVCRGEVKPVELVEEAIARTERLNPALNAVIHRQFERARRDATQAAARRALPRSAVPAQGLQGAVRPASRTTWASAPCATSTSARGPTAPWPRRFRSTGLIPIGRTNTPEMATMGTTEPVLYGPTHNPWDPQRSPGGSSGGSAAAVAARIVPAAHANDISGSIRIPAALCGLVGLKPTRGRVLTSDVIDPPIGMNTEGVVSRRFAPRRPSSMRSRRRRRGGRRRRCQGRSSTSCRAPPEPLRIGLWTTRLQRRRRRFGMRCRGRPPARRRSSRWDITSRSAHRASSRVPSCGTARGWR